MYDNNWAGLTFRALYSKFKNKKAVMFQNIVELIQLWLALISIVATSMTLTNQILDVWLYFHSMVKL